MSPNELIDDRGFRLGDYLASDPLRIDYSMYEMHYYNLLQDIDQIPAAQGAIHAHNGDTHLEKIRSWFNYKSGGEENYYGKFVEKDFPWVNDIIPNDNSFESYISSFVGGMEKTLKLIYSKWKISLGQRPVIFID